MKTFLSFLVQQRLISFLAIVLVAVVGISALFALNRESFPDVNLEMVTISTVYRGASPEEIEQLITIPIEKELRSVAAVDRVAAYNLESVSILIVYLTPGLADTKPAVDDIKTAVEMVTTIPAAAERPEIEELTTETQPVIDIAVTLRSLDGRIPDVDEYRQMRRLAKAIEDDLYDLRGVAYVERFGYLDREYLVEVDPEALTSYNLGLNYFLHVIGQRNVDMPSGVLRLGEREYMLRTRGQFESADEIRNVMLIANELGFGTSIGDVARVYDTFTEPTIYERLNGDHVVAMRVWKNRSADVIEMADDVYRVAEQFQELHGDQFLIETFEDASQDVKERLRSLITNGLVGLVLLVTALFLMIGFRLSQLVASVIPVVFLACFYAMIQVGITFNMISIFAMVMVLGLIVDFAIVVSENSFRHMQNGVVRSEAVERGLGEIFWPVSVTVLCIIAAFAPLLFMSGIMGKFVWAIPMVIIISLVAAWVHAMFLLPAQLNTFLPRRLSADKLRLQSDSSSIESSEAIERGPFVLILRSYRLTLRYALRFRYLVAAGLVVLLFGSIGAGVAWIGFVLFPPGGENGIIIKSELPQGTRLTSNLAAMTKLEELSREVVGEELVYLRTRVGLEEPNPVEPAPGEETHLGTIHIELSDSKIRDISADQLVDQLRRRVEEARLRGELPDNLRSDISPERNGPPVGAAINVEIRGHDFEMLSEIAELYVDYLQHFEGVSDIRTNLGRGKPELRFRVLDHEAAMTGLHAQDVALAIRTAFNGEIASIVNDGEDEIEIRVRFPEAARESLDSLNQVYIANTQGRLIPLSAVSTYEEGAGLSVINRLNYRRVATVQANVDPDVVTSMQANVRLQREMAAVIERYPAYDINYGGEQEDAQESIQDLLASFVLALFVIFMILAVFFRSLLTPMVIMSAIPFGLIGVMIGLILHQAPMSFMSLLGAVSLSGVIVSNTLVLVTFIDSLKAEGYSLSEALVEGGAMRLRPVMLTTGTTVLGLLPSVYGLGGIDHFVQPLAMGFAYGLIFASFITLVLIPVLYHIKEDFRIIVSRMFGRFGYDPLNS